MDLNKVRTPEQLTRALDEGDAELERQVSSSIQRLIERAWAEPTWDSEDMDAEQLVGMVDDEKLLEILTFSPRITDDIEGLLRPIPKDVVEKALRDEVERAAFAMRGRGRKSNVLSFSADSYSGRGSGIRLDPVHAEIGVRLRPPLTWLPKDKVLELLEHGYPGAAWEEVDEETYSSGWVETDDHWRLQVDAYALHEWAADLRQTYFSDVVESSPEAAIKAFLDLLKIEYPELAKKVKKAKFPKEILADYAVAYFEDPESGLEVITEAVGEFGYTGSRGDVLLELDRAALQAMGITEGRWWEGAPWKLINLPPEELLYEGTIMRHCVGRRDMGYRDAVKRGETQIWSLRSRFNKPVLTFEVDVHEWESGGPVYRGRAIDQLKGKLNRLAGEDEDEAQVLYWIFAKLGIDSAAVADFVPSAGVQSNPDGFNGPWRPHSSRRRGGMARNRMTSNRERLKRALMRG